MLLNVETNLKEAQQALDKLVAEQIPFATAYALTQTAKAAQREVEKEIARVFDRPTPYTLRAVRIRSATKRSQFAEVALKDSKATAAVSRGPSGSPVRSLYHHTIGVTRAPKPFENLLQARGLMPRGWYAVPGRDINLDQYGNVPSGLINRVLSQLQAHSVYQIDRNESAASKARQYRSRTKRLQRYFVVLPGDLKNSRLVPGIWERTSLGFGSAIRPLFIYVRGPLKYRKRLHFNEIVAKTVDAQIGFQFKRGVLEAQRTAK